MSNVERLDYVCLRIESGRQRSANFIGSKFCLRIFSRSSRVGAGEVRIHAVDVAESPVVTHMVVVSMGVQHAHWKLGQSCDYRLDIADAHAGVEQQRLVTAHDQIRDNVYQLVWFVNRKHSRTNLVHLKPAVGDWNSFQLAVCRARQVLAPLWLLRKQRGRQTKCDTQGAFHGWLL